MPLRVFARRSRTILWLLASLAVVPMSACAVERGMPAEPDTSASERGAPAVTAFSHGAYLGDAESTRDAIVASIGAFAERVGGKPAIVKTYFRLDDDFSVLGWPGQTLRRVSSTRCLNLVALDLHFPNAPEADLLYAIIRGAADEHIRRAARGLKDLREPVWLELAWEMNGSWGYPWQGVANGGDSRATSAFVQAWRRIVDIMRAEGAVNVRFVFSPNVGNSVAQGLGSSHWNWYGHYYPGDAYVDIVGLHGFNGPSVWGGAYATFAQLFDGPAMDAMLSDVERRFPGKPILISEFASEESATKPEWIRDAYAHLKARPRVIGAVWFDMQKETDWRIASSPQALEAYRDVVGQMRVTSR